MSEAQETLDDLREEVASEEAEALDKADAEAQAEIQDHIEHAETRDPVDLSPDQAVTALIGVGGLVVCKMARVPALQLEEEQMLSGAVKGVLDAYDFGQDLDPRTAAWIGLGMAGAAVVVPRLEYIGQAEAQPEEKGGEDGEGND